MSAVILITSLLLTPYSEIPQPSPSVIKLESPRPLHHPHMSCKKNTRPLSNLSSYQFTYTTHKALTWPPVPQHLTTTPPSTSQLYFQMLILSFSNISANIFFHCVLCSEQKEIQDLIHHCLLGETFNWKSSLMNNVELTSKRHIGRQMKRQGMERYRLCTSRVASHITGWRASFVAVLCSYPAHNISSPKCE